MTVTLFKNTRWADERGWFMETFREAQLRAAGIEERFVQDNQSWSATKGTIRGLHFQRPPHAQAKLVRCTRGSIWDVAVDIRVNSPTYGKWVAEELTENGEMLYIPAGFAHGFVTLSDNCEVHYKVSDYYSPQHEAGLIWSDPDLAISWPLSGVDPIVSEKDQALSFFRDCERCFEFTASDVMLTGVTHA